MSGIAMRFEVLDKSTGELHMVSAVVDGEVFLQPFEEGGPESLDGQSSRMMSQVLLTIGEESVKWDRQADGLWAVEDWRVGSTS